MENRYDHFCHLVRNADWKSSAMPCEIGTIQAFDIFKLITVNFSAEYVAPQIDNSHSKTSRI